MRSSRSVSPTTGCSLAPVCRFEVRPEVGRRAQGLRQLNGRLGRDLLSAQHDLANRLRRPAGGAREVLLRPTSPRTLTQPGCSSSPTPSTTTVTVCPAASGPTPGGVPVMITSPGSSVMMPLTNESSPSGLTIMSPTQAVLHLDAVDERAHARLRRRRLGHDPRPERAEGVEALGARPLAVDLLQVAGRHIVAARVAGDHRGGRGRRHVLAAPADHHDQLGLVVDLGASVPGRRWSRPARSPPCGAS